MLLNNLEVIRRNYYDVRFGEITVHIDINDEQLYMSKSNKFKTHEEFSTFQRNTEIEKIINFPNKMKILKTYSNKKDLKVTNFYRYPNSDLFDCIEKIKTPRVLFDFLLEMSEFLISMENNKLVYGDLRPDFIFFDDNDDKFTVITRTENKLNQVKTNIDNVRKNFSLYCSPEIFNFIIKLSKQQLRNKLTTSPIEYDKHKAEVFSLGMVVLRILSQRNEYRRIHNKFNKKFSLNDFEKLKRKIYKEFKEDFHMQNLIGFVFEKTLAIDPNDRVSPRELKASLLLKFERFLASQKSNLNISLLLSKNEFKTNMVESVKITNDKKYNSVHESKISTKIDNLSPLNRSLRKFDKLIQTSKKEIPKKVVKKKKNKINGKYFKLSESEKLRLVKIAQSNYVKFFKEKAYKIINDLNNKQKEVAKGGGEREVMDRIRIRNLTKGKVIRKERSVDLNSTMIESANFSYSNYSGFKNKFMMSTLGDLSKIRFSNFSNFSRGRNVSYLKTNRTQETNKLE